MIKRVAFLCVFIFGAAYGTETLEFQRKDGSTIYANLDVPSASGPYPLFVYYDDYEDEDWSSCEFNDDHARDFIDDTFFSTALNIPLLTIEDRGRHLINDEYVTDEDEYAAHWSVQNRVNDLFTVLGKIDLQQWNGQLIVMGDFNEGIMTALAITKQYPQVKATLCRYPEQSYTKDPETEALIWEILEDPNFPVPVKDMLFEFAENIKEWFNTEFERIKANPTEGETFLGRSETVWNEILNFDIGKELCESQGEVALCGDEDEHDYIIELQEELKLRGKEIEFVDQEDDYEAWKEWVRKQL